jgi:6-pyruvoyltetrahydropterin/6-carboxytetrahydropterin synthase
MTVFPDGRKERMHGHNFTIALECELAQASAARMVDFGPLKRALDELCAEWKEHLLLPAASPLLEVAADNGREIEFSLCGKRYVLPREDVLLLPVDNVSVEGLAQHAASRLAARLGDSLKSAGVRSLEVTIEETPGQGGSCRLALATDETQL